MGRIQLYYKVLKCCLAAKVVDRADIGNSYDLVSRCYDDQFLKTMQQYNIKMLSLLPLPEKARVLDLACGTGFNSWWLLQAHPDYVIDAVDISEGMLRQADRRLDGKANLIRSSALEFLGKSANEQYDLVVCTWALEYQPPIKVLRECSRVLKQDGQIGVILNSGQTLPEVRRVYKHLLIENSSRIEKLMLELPNPKDERHLDRWLRKAGFCEAQTFRGMHKFSFDSTAEMTDWVTSTGALAGFDVMADLHDEEVKKQVSALFERFGILAITHDFVWGIARKC
ncbi:MAG: methyltransferase domain-containing protein [Armatimonadetes bacterium]|nr:methyltransferase domain-containing protein [Armatimonadota bacterium]